MVKKPDGSNRFCIDFRKLNRVTVFDPEPIPNPQDLFASLSKSCFFTKLDLTKGYWQIPMEECDKEKTAFVTPDGKFHFRYMPFGMVTASAQFSKLMRQVLVGVPNVVNFIDDILFKTLKLVLDRLRRANLAARPSKCLVGYKSLEFLGAHTIQFILKVDASDTGLGAVLMQNFDSGEFPISYTSKKLLPRKKNYAVIEKECLAIVWAVKKFEFYLYGRVFEIHTDHKPLVYINVRKSVNKRIMRWSMVIQEFCFRLVAVKGRDIVGADFLSRESHV